MYIKNLFERTSSNWVRYSEYEWRVTEDGTLYLTPTNTAQPSIYDPLAEYQKIVLDAISIGRMGMSKKPDTEIQKAIQQFAVKYGLFGLMTALPTTPNFMEYEAVYLPENHFIKEETMSTEKYLALFFPFDKLDVIKRGIESMWNIRNDRVMMALALIMTDKPIIVWDFHSLLLGIQIMFRFMLTDSENPIKLCKHCTKAFVASRPSAVFCSPQCKNKHNAYKSRARKNSSDKE